MRYARALGLMRGREFLMKDAYSFDLDFEGAKHAYNRMFVAYLRTFARMGLRSIPMVAESGPIGGNLSHEFIIWPIPAKAKCSATALSRLRRPRSRRRLR